MSTERQRDAETDRLLRATLRPGVHAEACPGADLLAAYAEGSLSPTERDGLDGHFAECHRCQETLAFMARAWPTPDAAQSPTSARWWFLPMRWLVPLAAAAVIVLYVAVRPVIAPYFPPVDQSAKVEQPPAPEHVMADARPPEGKAIRADPHAGGEGRISPPLKSSGARVGRTEEARQATTTPGISTVVQNTLPKAPEVKGAAHAREVVSLSPPAPAPALALPQTTISESVVVTAPRADVAGAAGQQLALRAVATLPRDVVSPDGSAVWRIGPGGRLLRSTDRGATWQSQSSGVSVELLAGSAPSPTVCWIVGREATVIVTTGGAQWTTRPFPGRVDLVAVEATDARSATVTTRDGRRFATLDGGATWSAR